MIAIIDYGLGNLASIKNILKHIEVDSTITSDPEEIKNADRLLLPGVGKFDEGMNNLMKDGLDKIIQKEAHDGKPILGICLGMQLLGNSSEEGELKGLGLIDFDTVRFSFDKDINLKVPHMGWERVTMKETPLTHGLGEKQRYYFVHSFHAVCKDSNTSIIECKYGYDFSCGVRNGNVYGVQFHPEKSHRFGMKLLENFARI